jgi:hypothetical protein
VKKFYTALILASIILLVSCTENNIADEIITDSAVTIAGTEILDIDMPEDTTPDLIDDDSEEIAVSNLERVREIHIDWSEAQECDEFENIVRWWTYEEYKEMTELLGLNLWVSDGIISSLPLPAGVTEEEMLESRNSILEGLKNGTMRFGYTMNSIVGGGLCECCEDGAN